MDLNVVAVASLLVVAAPTSSVKYASNIGILLQYATIALISILSHQFLQTSKAIILALSFNPQNLNSENSEFPPPWNQAFQQASPQYRSVSPQFRSQMQQSSAMITNTAPRSNKQWFPDTGASFHVTSGPQNIQQVAPFEGPDQIFIGNAEMVKVCKYILVPLNFSLLLIQISLLYFIIYFMFLPYLNTY